VSSGVRRTSPGVQMTRGRWLSVYICAHTWPPSQSMCSGLTHLRATCRLCLPTVHGPRRPIIFLHRLKLRGTRSLKAPPYACRVGGHDPIFIFFHCFLRFREWDLTSVHSSWSRSFSNRSEKEIVVSQVRKEATKLE
jgi:hypothetical protein